MLEAHHGDALALLEAGGAIWRDAGLTSTQIRRLQGQDAMTQTVETRALRWLETPSHHLVGWADADYPPQLRDIASPPLALFIDGEPSQLWHPQIAIVGSRSATAGGLDNARHFAQRLAEAGLVITSGLAAGIDAAAHQGALDSDHGMTIAVVGTGPDIAYPVAHTALRDRISQRGAVVSEHPPGAPPLRRHFPARNRLVAGLSLATLVIEAAERSGALISARMAAEASREVFALPGSIHNPMARGCHQLLRDGALLCQSPDDLLETLAPRLQDVLAGLRQRLAAPTSNPSADKDETTNDPHSLWDALGFDPTTMDALVIRTGLTVAQLSPMLLALELEGRLSVEHGRYARKSA